MKLKQLDIMPGLIKQLEFEITEKYNIKEHITFYAYVLAVFEGTPWMAKVMLIDQLGLRKYIIEKIDEYDDGIISKKIMKKIL